MQMRLDKLLADMGIASRKELRELIRSGRVQVDGAAETRPERKLDPAVSTVSLDGEALRWRRFHYYMIDKPLGVVTATEDRRQQTVLDLLTPEILCRGRGRSGRGGRGGLFPGDRARRRDAVSAGGARASRRRQLHRDGHGGQIPPGPAHAGQPRQTCPRAAEAVRRRPAVG